MSSTSVSGCTDVPYLKNEPSERSSTPTSGGTDVLYVKHETSKQSSREVSTSQQYQPLDISRDFLVAAIAAKRGKTVEDYSEDLSYVLKDYALFHQCFLRKKNVREKNAWKESIDMWNVLKPHRYKFIVKDEKMAQRQWGFRKAITTKGDEAMIDDVERIVERFDDELHGVQPSFDPIRPSFHDVQPFFDPPPGPSTDSNQMQSECLGIKTEEPSTNYYRMKSEVIDISDSEDESASAGTKRKSDGSPMHSSTKQKQKYRRAARSSGFALRKRAAPPPHGANLEMMRQAINPYAMQNYASTPSGRSRLNSRFRDASNESVSSPAQDSTSNSSISESDMYNRMMEAHCREIEGYIIKYHCYYVGLRDVRNKSLSWAESKNDILQPLWREGRSFLDLMNANILNAERSLHQKGMDYLWAMAHDELREFANKRLRDLGYPVYYA